MLMSLNDETIARHEDHLEKLVSFRENMSSSSVAHVVGGNLDSGDQLPLQCPSALFHTSANVSDPFAQPRIVCRDLRPSFRHRLGARQEAIVKARSSTQWSRAM
uniref:Uncharacterized protein n=1 Tax=Peronospora matthiolae TaxID=2874970 RepID=A0AAV1TMW6_9STRA